MVSNQTPETTINNTVPVANGTGASTETAVSVSTPARPTRSPSGRRWCHEIGCRMSRSTTPWLSDSATRHWVSPAHVRRTTTPTARTTPIAMIIPTPAATVPAATSPSSSAARSRGRSPTRRPAPTPRCTGRRSPRPPTARANRRGCSRTWAANHPQPLAGAVEPPCRRRGTHETFLPARPAGHAPDSCLRLTSFRGDGPARRGVVGSAPGVRCHARLPRLQQDVRVRRPRRDGRVLRVDRHALAARPGPARRRHGDRGRPAVRRRPPDTVRGRGHDRLDGGGDVDRPSRQRPVRLQPGMGVHGVDRRRRLGDRHDRTGRLQPRRGARPAVDRLERSSDRRAARPRRGLWSSWRSAIAPRLRPRRRDPRGVLASRRRRRCRRVRRLLDLGAVLLVEGGRQPDRRPRPGPCGRRRSVSTPTPPGRRWPTIAGWTRTIRRCWPSVAT